MDIYLYVGMYVCSMYVYVCVYVCIYIYNIYVCVCVMSVYNNIYFIIRICPIHPSTDSGSPYPNFSCFLRALTVLRACV